MFNLKLLKVVFVMVTVSIFVVSSVATTGYAQGKGRGQKERPPGWDRGEKEDWTSNVPPGQEESGPPGWKEKEGEKKGWFSDVPPGLAKKEGWIPPGWSKREKKELMNILPPGLRKGSATGAARKFELADRNHSKIKEEFFSKKEELKDAIKKMRNARTKEEKMRLEQEKDRIEAEKDALEERLQKAEEAKENAERELEDEKKKFSTELKNAKDIIRKRATKMRFSSKEKNEILTSLEISSRYGVPPRKARSIVESAMNKGMRARAIEKLSRAVSYGVGREVKFDQLGKFVNEKLEAGLRDEELSLEVYKEVQRRHEEKTKVRKAIQEEKKKKEKGE